MPPLLLSFFFCYLLSVESKETTTNERMDHNCTMTDREILGGIGGVIDQSSRVGKEQKISMELAVQDFHRSTCYNMVLHLKDSSAKSAEAAMKLVGGKQVQVIMGVSTPEEAALVSEFDTVTPIISLTPTAIFPPLLPPFFIQMSTDIGIHMQCIAAIVGHFRWRKVTAIYEHSNTFSSETGFITELSNSLRDAESSIENYFPFPPITSLSNPTAYISNELVKLRSLNNRVFVILKSSLKFAVLLFERAKQMGMMGKGYVWIVSDDICSLLDSVGKPVISNMEGVIGFKTNFVDTSDSFEEFERRFRKKYSSEYPDEEHSNPSIYALHAYDATWAIAKAVESSNGSKKLFENILASNFKGLSGVISFKNGKLAELPTFQIINVIGKSYREMTVWSPEFGFSGNGLVGELSSIYWPGGGQTVPKGWTLSNREKPLKIGVPARGAFNHFVKVSYGQNQNETFVAGFSIEVFEAAIKRLPYNFPYVFIPYYGSYDEMVADVHNKGLDAAVGDTEIMADRYKIAEFSQPYMESGLVMVVTVKPDVTKERFLFLKAFSMKMWLLMAVMSFSIGFVVWLTENVENNPEFGGSSFAYHVGKMLWFSVTVLSFAQKESIKSNLSRFVLATWFFVIVVVTACFTANLTSIITVQRVHPSIVNMEYLQRTNAGVGCNGNSFIVRYLINVLHFKPENIKRINSIGDYPEAFDKGEISAAFFVAPHAKVFLAEYCQGYTMAGPNFKLGGFGFVFPKGSPLAVDISEAILQVTESGEILHLERQMLSFSNCSSSSSNGLSSDPSLGPEPFSGLFIISGCICAVAFFISTGRILIVHPLILMSCIQVTLVRRRIGEWASSMLSRNFRMFGFGLSGEANNQTGGRPQNSMGIELARAQTPEFSSQQQQVV